jgi:hypothetical protein
MPCLTHEGIFEWCAAAADCVFRRRADGSARQGGMACAIREKPFDEATDTDFDRRRGSKPDIADEVVDLREGSGHVSGLHSDILPDRCLADGRLDLFASAIIEGRPIQLFNHGHMQRDFTFVDDVVEGVVPHHIAMSGRAQAPYTVKKRSPVVGKP